MENIYYLFEFVSMLIKTSATFVLLNSIFLPRWNEKTSNIVGLLSSVLLAAISTYNVTLGFSIFSNLMTLFVVFVTSIVIKVITNSKWYDGFFLSFVTWVLIVFGDFFLLSILHLFMEFLELPVGLFVEINLFRGVYLLFYSIAVLRGVKITTDWISGHDLDISSKWKRLKIWSVFVVIILILAVIYFQRVYILLVTNRYIISWFILGTTLFGSIIGFQVYRFVSVEKEKETLQEMQVKMLQENYVNLLKSQEDKSILLHDMKNHMIMLTQMIEENEVDKALNYIENIGEGLNKGTKKKWANHPMMDMIFTAKYQEALENGIEMQLECDDMTELLIEPNDICALFANILDNAIEANLKLDLAERWIKLSCKKQRYMLVVSLSNPTVSDMDLEKGLPETTKENKALHGFGMRSIKKVVNKYHGSMKISSQGNEFRMIIGMCGFE